MKPKNTGVGSLSLLQGSFPTQESNQCLLHCRWILYQLSYLGSQLWISIHSFHILLHYSLSQDIDYNSLIYNKTLLFIHSLHNSLYGVFDLYHFFPLLNSSVQFSSVAQSCTTLCNTMNCSTPGLPVHHQLLEFTQTHVHRVGDATQPSHPLSSPSPPAPNPSQHQSLFQ